ncbi:MAG: AAA family ATPase [Candidatus Zixiibacteriota bacterium]
MIYLREISIRKANSRIFPFNLDIVKNIKGLNFDSPVTFFVGENGSGKSTIIEALAAFMKLPIIGGESIGSDPSLRHARELADFIRPSWEIRTHRGFFLRAEDFFRFTRKLQETVRELDDDIAHYEENYSGYGLQLARGSAEGQKKSIIRKYGDDLNANSHGESFLKLFQERFVPKGIYLLDEPEVPLSPLRQIGLLSMIKEMVDGHDSQFIIATHSPILMAYPGANIYNFDTIPPELTAYEDLEHVNVMRNFLDAPERYLRYL